MENSFLTLVEIIGTIAFAISGIRMAADKHFDWFGAYTIGFVTAIGGGTLRDMLLGIPVFWMQTWWYLAFTGLAFIIVVLLRKSLIKHLGALLVFDTVGLASFVVIGIQKTLASGYPMWVAIVMGIITGAFGGIIRDILINEAPLFFRKDIYATACLAGGIVYWIISLCGGSSILQQCACAVMVITLRTFAVKYSWSLPTVKNDTD